MEGLSLKHNGILREAGELIITVIRKVDYAKLITLEYLHGLHINKWIEDYRRGKIRLVEGNAKCLRLRTPYPPLTHCIRVYSILIQTRKRGEEGVES